MRVSRVLVRRSLLIVCALVLAAGSAAAQEQDVVDYGKAERLLSWNASLLISGDEVRPEWMQGGSRFWYRNKTATGADYVLIDPVRNTRGLLFDNARLAAAMSMTIDTSYDPDHLPFRTFKFAADGTNEHVIEFTTGKRRFSCDIAAYRCVVGDTTYNETRYVLSPDKKWEAFVNKYNLYVRSRGGGDSVQLTTDGERYWSYGLDDPRPSEIQHHRTRRPMIRWAPDSKKLAVMRQDQRGVKLMYYISATTQRPKLYSQPYALPGDSIIPKPNFNIIDLETKSNIPVTEGNIAVAVSPTPDQLSFTGSSQDSAWAPGSDKLYVTYFTRGSKAVYLAKVDAKTGQSRILVGDSAKTWVEFAQADPPSWWVSKDGNDIIWWSERSGWAHLYLFNENGTLKNQITHGAWAVGAVEHVDATKRQVYFTAYGREPGVPYYRRLYRANFDGTGLTLLSPEDANHDITFSPSGRYFVDSYSRVEAAPVTVLRAVPDGRMVRTLEQADLSRLVTQAGWQPARVFHVKARDGITDLYGVLYLPPDFDSTTTYPIIDHIYPGPQVGSVGRWTFKGGGDSYALAALGFVVVELDAMGTPLRSKAFHDTWYGNFGDNGLPDQVTAIKQLAARYPFIDLNRVGIWGHSGGGFASTDAMLRYPNVFKVAVSESGNHDNRTYNIYWAEKYEGLLRRDTLRKTDNFAASANKAMAKNLRGHLLLVHGDMDDNVNPANTIQVVDELIKANQTFDMLIAPNRNHGLNEPYFIRRRWDYFVQYLLGKTPPVNYLITRPISSAAPAGQPAGPSLGEPWLW